MPKPYRLIAIVMLFSSSLGVSGQVVPPFFTGGATAFDPQIGIVNSGVVQDVRAVVSSDMKYVTLTIQPQNAGLLALQAFTFQNLPSLGVVGLPATIAPSARNSNLKVGKWEPVKSSAAEVSRHANAWILDREGMFRVGEAN